MMEPASVEEIVMIEAAARAAGYEVRRYRVRDLEVVHVGVGDQWALFDPRRHDGDAYRLLVDCKLSLRVGTKHAVATAWPGDRALDCFEDVGENPAAAGRMAITRAAAALHEHRSKEAA
ncbi:hypothetical protein [Cupriavidus alkaliphilus]|uniref:Phage ABA sandwich domain-containing protein n=1 Tax=Cupriavidus alkaliphilus TaxID=942866 RepID=A0A7W4VG58_9BURK|nr:hypothetical protein [Cupriavidus alkaliphilus]MBB3010659.1 hypothetical protein [Cupriavidus alkaliphilus]